MSADLEENRGSLEVKRGHLIFALMFILLSISLLLQIEEQTKWVLKVKFAAQPRFWPAVSLIGMVSFAGLYILYLPQKNLVRADWLETRKWLQTIEFPLWFMIYVNLNPILGYLPSTLIFVPALIWRMGYRTPIMFKSGVAFALVVVIVFKSFLDVKIPGGAIYEFFPNSVRNFFILNF